MQRYNHPPLFGAPPPKGQQGPKPTFHKIPSQHYNVTVAGWSKQIESQWRSCVQIGLYVYGSNCLFSFMEMRDDLYCTVRVQYVLVLVHRPIHRRTVHRGLGARDPSFLKFADGPPSLKIFFTVHSWAYCTSISKIGMNSALMGTFANETAFA